MKKISFILAIALLLSALTACAGEAQGGTPTQAPPQQQSSALPETTISETAKPETTKPDTTKPDTTIPDTTIPEKTQRSVSSFERLSALAIDRSLIPETVIHIVEPIKMLSAVRFSVPVSFSIEADVTFDHPIVIETDAALSIEINISSAAQTTAPDFIIDAPNCDLTWLSGAPYTDEEQAASLLNVKSYNGTDLREKYGIGGDGTKKITSFSLTAKENPLLDSAIEWSIQGNTLFTALSYLVNYHALDDAAARIELDDGSVITKKLDLSQSEQTLCIEDGNGGKRNYKIVTERITYNLPVFYIDIDGGKEVSSREEYLRAKIRVDTSNAAGDFPALDSTEVNIRGRGHFSWNFDKTPYKLKFDQKTSVMGMNAAKDWVLLANYVDRSLIQNYVALEMGKVMTNIPYHSTQYPVDVFVNGTYRGVYTFGEQLEVKKARIDLEESYTEADTDYLLEIGGNDEGDVLGRDFFHSFTLKYVKIKHPDSDKLTEEQLNYLFDYVEKADLSVKSLENYEEYIDIDSLIDWVIIHELTYNLDCCFRRSCYLIKEKGGKLKMGPIWDFDLGFGSYYRYKTDNWATVGEDGGYVWVTWMNYLMKDEAFMEKFRARWNEIKEPLLKKALDCVAAMSELVAPSAEMNFEVWDILGKNLSSQPSSHKKYDTYEKMVDRLEDFLKNRYKWMDKQLNP